MSENWQIEFARDASLLPHVLDPVRDLVLLSRLQERAYQEASFLDQRLGTKGPGRVWVHWRDLATVALGDNPEPQFIFHIGHVGSTLVSRLLGELHTVFSLREPQLLRSVAEIGSTTGTLRALWSEPDYHRRLESAIRWYSRRFGQQQTALVKASSFVSDIAGDVLGTHRKALFLYVSPERYIETILAGEASLRDMHVMAPSRIDRLQRLLPGFDRPLWQMSVAERIAMSWLCETTSLLKAAKHSGRNVLWQDFDTFLEQPAESLQLMARFLGHELSQSDARALVGGPIMSTYSKAPEHRYSADLRNRLLAQAGSNFATEIADALSWANSVAERYTLASDAMNLTNGVRDV